MMPDDKKWREMVREYTGDSMDSMVEMVEDENAIPKLYVWIKKALGELEVKQAELAKSVKAEDAAAELYRQSVLDARELRAQLARLEKAWPCGEECATRSCRYCGVVPGNHHAGDCFYTRNNYGRWVSKISFGPCNCDRAAKFGRARDG